MAVAEMLWETTSVDDALRDRFAFGDPGAAAAWLSAALPATHGIAVEHVTRVVVSAGNLLAFVSSDAGELVVKCSAVPALHPYLEAVGDLLLWLEAEHDLPVSAPLRASSGASQVRHEHLSVGVQRHHPGDLLDADDLSQARAAGEMLARLHQATADYDGAAAFPRARPGESQPRSSRALVESRAARESDDARLAPVARRLGAVVADLPDADPPLQLVHDDIRSANLLWSGGEITAVLDFEETHRSHAMDDVARSSVVLATRYHAWGPPTPEARETFLAGYLAVARPDETERAWLEALVLARALEAAESWGGAWATSAAELVPA